MAGPSKLLDPAWSIIDQPALDAFSADDWSLLGRQRKTYYAEEQARQALRLLEASRDDTSFGYAVNNYRHCIQAATLALRDGQPDDYVVTALLHDIGFVACPDSHGAFSAALLAPYVSPDLVWILERHMWFLDVHCDTHPACDPNARERWRGHPYFEAAAHFVARYDQTTIRASGDELPLSVFVPLVQRVFARPPRPMPFPL